MTQTKAQLIDGKSAEIEFSGGSAGAPAISFTGDPNTGIYSPGADQVAISTNSTGRLFIDSSGFVQVGAKDGNTALLEIGAGATGNRFALLDFIGDTTYTDYGLRIVRGSTGANAASQINHRGTGTLSLRSEDAAPITFDTSSSERLRITSDGLVGVGTSSPGSILHCNYATATDTYIRTTNSAGTNGFDFGVSSGGEAWVFNRNNSNMYLGTNSAQRVTITAGGNVGIGTTSPQATLDVQGAVSVRDGSSYQWRSASGGTDQKIWDVYADNTSGNNLAFRALNDAYSAGYAWLAVTRSGNQPQNIIFYTGAGSERARIDSSGRLLVGTSSSNTYAYGTTPSLQVESNSYVKSSLSVFNNENTDSGSVLSLGKSRGTSVGSNTVVQNNDYLGEISWVGADGSNRTSIAASINCRVDGTPGANDMPGRLVFSTTADGASSPTQRMVIKQSGLTAFYNGTPTFAYGDAAGFQIAQAGYVMSNVDGERSIFINRKTNDGGLIEFAQDGVVEGSISVSGNTISYNGAHLSRWSQLPSGAERTEILRGSVLSNIDEMCEWGDEDNEQLNRMKVSDVEGDKNVAGVFQAWDDDDDTYTNDFYCAMTGDFIIRIGAGVTVERGDLLMSAGDGTAKPQDDDIIRSKTIAKVTSTNVSCTYDDGSYCVPCVLMAC